jgi:hypothetical protein
MEEAAKVCLTTSPRAMGILIGLKELGRMHAYKVRAAILALDDAVLSPEATERLLTADPKSREPVVFPSEEEIAAAAAHVEADGPFDVLCDASKFLVAVRNVPHLHDRPPSSLGELGG